MSEKDGSGVRLRNAAPTQRSSEDPVSCTAVVLWGCGPDADPQNFLVFQFADQSCKSASP
jgi:hypothetical protein